MKSKKILYVCSEMTPYLPESKVGNVAFDVAKTVNITGAQIRIFMPRYGVINERRHQLHEVIRLSGMNLVVNDIDMPLIIKVASVPKERVQVYFIDNDEYFKRKEVFSEGGQLYPDNDERCIFFAKGIVETVKKLNWTPDIIHIQGWLGFLLPLYLKTHYKDEPIFASAKIITSVFDQEFEGELDSKMMKKILFDGIDKKSVASLAKPNYENLLEVAIKHSEAVVIETPSVSERILENIVKYKKPVRSFVQNENEFLSYAQFYETIIEGKSAMKKLRLKIEQLLILLAFLLIGACNTDQDAVLLKDSILGDVNFLTESVDIPVEVTNTKVNSLQTSGLTSYPIGRISQESFGQTNASIVAQVTLPRTGLSPVFGIYSQDNEGKTNGYNEEETVTDVFLYLPFFSKKIQTDATTQVSTYSLDSIYGNKTATFSLSVNELNYYLSSVNTNLENKVYFSDENPTLGPSLGQIHGVTINNSEIVRYHFDDPNSTSNEGETVRDRLIPGIRVRLDNAFFQKNLLNKEGTSYLETNANFTKFFKGIVISATNFSEDILAYLDTSKAKIQVEYSYKSKRSDNTLVQKKSLYELELGGITFSKQNVQNELITMSSEKIYLKGGQGYLAEITIPKTQIELLKQKKALIRQAELFLFVDESVIDAKNPNYVIIYNATKGTPLADYTSDITLNNRNILSIGKLEKNASEQLFYRLLITDHLSSLLLETTISDVKLGLGVSQSTDEATMVARKYKIDGQEKYTVLGNAETHLSTILHGGALSVPQNKRLVLKVNYAVSK